MFTISAGGIEKQDEDKNLEVHGGRDVAWSEVADQVEKLVKISPFIGRFVTMLLCIFSHVHL